MTTRWRLVTFLLLLGLCGCDPIRVASRHQERRVERRGFHQELVTRGGLRVRCWVGGAGSPVLLLHGFGGDGLWTWRSQIGALAEEHTVLVPDLLWFGGSDADVAPTLDAQVQAALAVLDAHGAQRAAIAGISYGGFVALNLAISAPDRVSHLILLDSPGPYFSEADERAMLDRLGFERPEDLFVPQTPEAVRALLALAYAHPPPTPPRVLSALQEGVFSANQDEQRGLLRDLVARREGADALRLARPVPVLVIWGDGDPVFPLALGETLATALGAGLVVVPDTAHAPNLERPDVVNTAILRFLSETPQDRP